VVLSRYVHVYAFPVAGRRRTFHCQEPPLPSPRTTTSLVPRTHLIFSHTTKGQPYNMPLLAHDAVPPRLIDFELITDGEGGRTVGFGWFAGGESFVFCTRWSGGR